MNYQLELDINAPRERVIELFLDPDNLKKWQPDLVSFTLISGVGREVGAKSSQIQRMGKRESEIIETIVEPNPPYEYAATYEGGSVWNLIENRFVKTDGNTTHWILDNTFKASGVIGILSFVMPGMFKKQTLKFMNMFKTFVEVSCE